MEYSGALAAGNQAWQRNGRAYSFGLAGIPYLYVAELGGYELDTDHVRRAPRSPNPAVPFSYVSYSSSLDTPVLPVFVPNPGIDQDASSYYSSVIGEEELVEFVRTSVLNGDTTRVANSLRKKALTFVQQLASRGRRGRTLTTEQWGAAHQAVMKGGGSALLSYLLREASLGWSKTAYIKSLTDSARELMQVVAKLSVGLTSSSLPMCIIPPESRFSLGEEIERLYPSVDDEFLDWLPNKDPLVICWVMGFKPKGEDARPDRGLPPFTRMLIGPDAEMLTVVYGPAREEHWTSFVEDPRRLAIQNGLWESIMATSNAILVDSATDTVTTHGYLRSHWGHPETSVQTESLLVDPRPQRLGEHDVDTVIHMIFARLSGNQAFEGLCNPPGGDWSGLSLLTSDKTKELRWLSLPRVSGSNAKRPDHVVQLFGLLDEPIVLAIESKAKHSSVEQRIGGRLTTYVATLLDSPASIERPHSGEAIWTHSRLGLVVDALHLASAAAYLLRNITDLTRGAQVARADLQIGLRFKDDPIRCEVHLLPTTALGRAIADFLACLPLQSIGVTVSIHQ